MTHNFWIIKPSNYPFQPRQTTFLQCHTQQCSSFGEHRKTQNKTNIMVGINKSSILNSISLNASRDRMNELFNDFKQMNVTDNPSDGNNQNVNIDTLASATKVQSEAKAIQATTDQASNGNDSIELVKVTMVKPNKLCALYVGDLDPNVTEETLYNYFKRYASLSSVKICYAPNSKKSLGYGYVNFESRAQSKQALDELNYTKLLGKEIRIMESLQGRDKLFLGTNVFISNLNTKGLDTRSFYQKFKRYGSILSCKLDLQKKQGFISFENKTVAEDFIKNVNDSIIDGSKVYCAIHIPKTLREHTLRQATHPKAEDDLLPKMNENASTVDTTVRKKPNTFKPSPVSATAPAEIESTAAAQATTTSNTNLVYLEPFNEIYIKGLPADCSETEVLKLFSSCGKIVEVFLENVPHFRSSWSLVTFEANESAINAVETYHKTLYKGRRLTCVKALKKIDRQIQLSQNAKNSSISKLKKTDSPTQSFQQTREYTSNLSKSTVGTHRLYLYNLPEGLNENFFKLFLRNYSFQGRILKYSINSSNHFKDCSYIDFENEQDAKDVNAKLNGINICGYVLVSALEKKNIGSCLPQKQQFKRSLSVSQDNTTRSQFKLSSIPFSSAPLKNRSVVNPGYLAAGFPNPSTVGLSPQSFQHQDQIPQRHETTQNHLQKALVFPQVNFHQGASVSTSSPMPRRDLFHQQSNKSSDSTFEKLEAYALHHIDFLLYPAATRPNNLKRILHYIVDTCWGNDTETVHEFLNAIEFDPLAAQALKEKLIETIKLFGFDR